MEEDVVEELDEPVHDLMRSLVSFFFFLNYILWSFSVFVEGPVGAEEKESEDSVDAEEPHFSSRDNVVVEKLDACP